MAIIKNNNQEQLRKNEIQAKRYSKQRETPQQKHTTQYEICG